MLLFRFYEWQASSNVLPNNSPFDVYHTPKQFSLWSQDHTAHQEAIFAALYKNWSSPLQSGTQVSYPIAILILHEKRLGIWIQTVQILGVEKYSLQSNGAASYPYSRKWSWHVTAFCSTLKAMNYTALHYSTCYSPTPNKYMFLQSRSRPLSSLYKYCLSDRDHIPNHNTITHKLLPFGIGNNDQT